MKTHKPLTNAAGDVREVTLEDLKQFKPASDVLADLVGAELAANMLVKRKSGRPKAASPKVYTGMRLDADVLAYFKADGQGWQTRINNALKLLITGERR
jgi:uncharacterized protein (DUF4415 family)